MNSLPQQGLIRMCAVGLEHACHDNGESASSHHMSWTDLASFPGLVPRPFLLHGLVTRLGQSWPEVVLFLVAFG